MMHTYVYTYDTHMYVYIYVQKYNFTVCLLLFVDDFRTDYLAKDHQSSLGKTTSLAPKFSVPLLFFV